VDLGALRRPHGLVEVGGKIYFTAEGNSAVARYDPVSDRVDWIMGTGQIGTHMLVVHPDGNRIYTANIGSGTVSVLDLLPTPGPPGVAHIAVGKEPEAIALSPDGNELWVGSRAGGGITVVDTVSDTVKASIPFEGVPIRLQFTPDGKRVLASNPPGAELVVFDVATRKETKRVPVGPVPVGILVTPDGKRAFVATVGANSVVSVDLETLAVAGTVETGAQPDGLAWAAVRTAPTIAMRPQGFLGVAIAPLSEEVRKGNNLESSDGVVVQALPPGSAAGAAGVQEGDVIVAVNGVKIPDVQRFLRLVTRGRAGDVLELELIRRGRKITKKATLVERPKA
jgi:YVTN family beta-propeller protein